MRKMPSYLSQAKKHGPWRFIRYVPRPEGDINFEKLFGCKHWFVPLGTTDYAEAVRLAKPHRDRTDEMIRLARAGEYPPLSWEFVEIIPWHFAKWLDDNETLWNREHKYVFAREFIEECEPDLLEEMLRQFLTARDITAKATGENYIRILSEIRLHFDVKPTKAANGTRASVVAPSHSPLRPTPAAPTTNPAYQGLRLPDAAQSWKKYIETFLDSPMMRNLSSKGVSGYRTVFRRFEQVVGEKPIAEVSTLDLDDFNKKLLSTPSDKRPGRMLDYDTRFRAISNIRQFFKWAVSEHLSNEDPTRRLVLIRDEDEEDFEREPFSTSDLNRLFQTPLYTGCRGERAMLEAGNKSMWRHSRFWYPLVAMFTGMRPSEIKQLEFEDIVRLNGRDHFYVQRQSAHGHKKRLKTKRSSIRQIPIHRELLRIGFLEWVKERKKLVTDGHIFADYEPIGEWFNGSLLPLIGIDTAHDNKVFYSFRHGFKDRLREASPMNTEIQDRYMGHFTDGTGALYGGRDILSVETAVIDLVKYPGVDLSHLKRG